MSNITIVTAFFDIGRGELPAMKHGRILPHHQHRSTEMYFHYFENLARLNNPMVIYTTPDLVDRVVTLRKKYGHDSDDMTTVIHADSYLPEPIRHLKDRVQEIMDNPEFVNMVDNPQLIEYWHSDYVLINMMKSGFVASANFEGYIKTPLAAWIDFGYVRSLETIPEEVVKNGWSFNFDPEKIHLFNQRPLDIVEKGRSINDIIKTGDVYIQGCHIVGGTEKWNDFAEKFFEELNTLLINNVIDDDQTVLLMTALNNPKLVELHYNTPDDWFRVFKDYNNA